MQKIGDLLARDLGKRIEEIIKVSQTDEESVYSEITEYVVTERIKDEYLKILKAIAEAPSDPNEGVGVWISGFFGSGKSSFAKNLGYILANRTVLEKRASELFSSQVNDIKIQNLIESINLRIPTEVIMFDVSVDRRIKGTERIAEIMYTVLLRELDYAEDFNIAELEIELEKEGKLSEFITHCQDLHKQEWRIVRKGAQRFSRASAILNKMYPSVYTTPESWAHTSSSKNIDVTVGTFVDRTFELCAFRRLGKGLVFIIDEVGQYVARSAEKIEDLRAVVEQFGKVSKNLLKAKKAIAPVWIVVTSQEKLDEVVAAIDSKRVELAKLQDRFKHRIDLSPADIREVATRRVLAKKDTATATLKNIFYQSQGQLNTACRFERTARKNEITEEDFINFYPYLPHFVELSIDIMSGIRLQPGAPKQLGGSNRTIIKQAYEMLISDRTALATKPVGLLVTLDKIFELVEGNLSSERQKDINDIKQRFKDDAEDKGMTSRVAKAICLLEFVHNLPRTEHNIAASLVDEVGKPSPLLQVQEAIKKLENAQFIRNTEEGWKLQTAQEKNWETERRSFLDVKPKERNESLREILRDIFSDPKYSKYKFKDLKSFQVAIYVDGVRVGNEGHIPLYISVAESKEDFPSVLNQIITESRQDSNRNNAYWIFSLTSDIDDLIANLQASKKMVNKYDQLKVNNRINNEEAACLSNEKQEIIRLQGRLRDKITDSLETGQGVFQGVSRDAAALGKKLNEIIKGFLDYVVPYLYPKLEMGARSLKGTEAEDVLKETNLSVLPQVFFGDQGLNLVIKDGTKFVPNTSADIAKEVLDYLKLEHSYGNKVTGKLVADRFQGVIYGWDLDVIRLVLAVLLRAGAIEVTHQGKRYRNHQDPQSRVSLTNNTAFRAASFTPRESIDRKTLTTAVQYYEDLTGEEVDVEESAIATEFKKLALEEEKLLLPVIAKAKVHQLPIIDLLQEYYLTLSGVISAPSDDCVKTLAGEGKSFRENRDEVRKIRETLNDSGIAIINQSRAAIDDMWPILEKIGFNETLSEKAKELCSLLDSSSFFKNLEKISKLSQNIANVYKKTYDEIHSKRTELYYKTIEELKGRAEWQFIPEETTSAVIFPLSARVCEVLDLPNITSLCKNCRATISQMDSDLVAINTLKHQAQSRIQELASPIEKTGFGIKRVRVAELVTETLDSEESVKSALKRVEEHLLNLIDEGAKIILE